MKAMSNRYLIVADDFTGANDTGVQLRRRGFSTGVVFAGRPLPAGMSCAVIDTESRALPPEEAAAVVAEAMRGVDPADFKYIIKKVDSTLRGCIAQEVLAMDKAAAPELIVFMPALPDLGRTTVDGIHMLNGVPITKTQLANDPRTPVREDNITDILRAVYSEPVTQVGLAALRGGDFDLSAGRIFTFDAEKNEDMRLAIAAAKETGKRVLWVGTAAMADNIMELDRKTLPVFGAAASLSDVTARQLENAAAAGVRLVSVPFHRILSGEESGEAYVRECSQSLNSGRDTLMVSSSSIDRGDLKLAEKAGADRGMSLSEVGAFVRRRIGELTAAVLEAAPVSGIFLTGGDTAMGVMDALGADGSEILAEISVGIPMVKLLSPLAPGLKAVTKAGAFGPPDAISFAYRKLKEA